MTLTTVWKTWTMPTYLQPINHFVLHKGAVGKFTLLIENRLLPRAFFLKKYDHILTDGLVFTSTIRRSLE